MPALLDDLVNPRAEQASEHDLHQIWSWNSDISPVVNGCVHHLITQQMQPEAQAICSWDGELTYRELDTLSTRLANELTRLEVSPEAIIPLCFEKSMWMPVAMLGVMKAGGASCAIDITQPEARLRTIMREVRPRIVLSSADQLDFARNLSANTTIVVVDKYYLEQLPRFSMSLPRVPSNTVGPNNTLYLVFTSGSTGKPKGVVITHSNFSSALVYQNASLGFQRTSRVLDFASYAFDAAWYNSLHTFYAGGCLCIPSEQDRRNDLAGCIRRLRPNFANLTPKLCEFLDTTSLEALDMIELAGEAPDDRQINRIRKTSTVRFAYGPAECSVLSTVTNEYAKSSSIGKGLGIRTWVVNADNMRTLMPIGSVGELWIEGPLVGRGYLNDADKTTTAFIDNPPWLLQGGPGFAGRPGRLYRTGDLVRYATDGSLLFVGRKDGQVKIRGQRVELGEVEHHIRQILTHCVAYPVVVEVIKPSRSDDAMLVAFIQTAEAVTDIIIRLEEKLIELLPTYMVPSAYISIEKIPISQTGKTDRQQLRRLGATFTLEQLAALNLARRKGRSPKTTTEQRLQKLWGSVLNINPTTISAEDSFLKIGGDSIKIMRLVVAAREYGISISTSDVFKHPRLCDLATVMRVIPSGLIADETIAAFSLISKQNKATIRKTVARLCGIEVVQVEDVFPCTPLQEGLLSLSALREGKYIVQSLYELLPSVDLNQFQIAWEKVALQAPILRTRIVDLGEHGLTQVVTNVPVEWSVETSANCYTETKKPCAMGLGTPLARFSLVKTETSGRQFFMLTMHHAICDGWSVPLLYEMAEKAYHGQSMPQSPPFQAFIRHIRHLDEEDAASMWRRYLHGTEAQPFPRLPRATFHPRSDTELVHIVTKFRWLQTGATPANVVRAAWSILVAQYTATSDVVFGATVSGRQAPVAMVEQMTGPTIATVPVRVVLDWEERVEQFIGRIQEQAIEMATFEQMGLQWIRRICEDTEKACQFQTLLIIQPAENDTYCDSSLFMPSTERHWELGSFNPYALLLECRLTDDGVQFRISFDSTVLEEQQAKRIMQQLEHTLRQLCAPGASEKMLSDIDNISEQDLLDIWRSNRTVPSAVEACVQDLISETIHRQPTAPAICAWDGELTYDRLDKLSTRLANDLRILGVGPAVIVPVYLEKSMWAPVAMLAVLKAGGAFTMLPPSLPSGRRESMIKAVQPVVVITCAQYAHQFSQPVIIIPQEDQIVIGDEDNRDGLLPCQVGPDTTAAVLFTSGTTGHPKGIVLNHRSLSTTAQYLGRDFKAGISTRVFQYASYSFDVSIHETFMVLLAGGCLCIPSEDDRHNNLVGSLMKLQANWACLSPSVARIIAPDNVPTLEILVFAGEALAERDILRWVDKVSIFNWYGPAEFSLCSTASVQFPAWTSGSLGFASASSCWVVRPENQDFLSPMGAIGELVVEGPGLMTGYLNDREKTATAVMNSPSWLIRGAPDSSGRQGRIYKTGDLVRYNTDGSLIYIGRKDAQVKIRGQRVELEEVEHQLFQNLRLIGITVSQVVAEVVTPKGDANSKLVAFVEGGEVQTQVVELQKILATVLPSYMIPSAYINISTIPITANGKTDRKKLREIGNSFTREEITALHPTQKTLEHLLPETTVEKQLHQLWELILRLKAPITMDDDFFKVGGDSIAAMRLVTAAREQGLSFTVADVFSRPRLGDLAVIVQQETQKENVIAIPPFSLVNADACMFVRKELTRSISISDIFPVTCWQSNCIDLAQERPSRLWNYFLIDLPPDCSWEETYQSCTNLWENLDILRVIFIRSDNQYLQVVTKQQSPLVKHYSTNEPVQDMTARICDEDSRQPFALGTPFTRFYILSGSNRALRLMIRLSHAQYDSTTLIHAMQCLRASFQREPLPLSVPFSAFVHHSMNSHGVSTEYWRSFLLDAKLTRIAADHTKHGSIRTLDPIIVEQRVQILRSTSRFTPATTFTAACARFLSRITKSSDVTFGRLASGRAMLPVQLRNTVGPCLNIIPVRIQGALSLEQTLESVHGQFIESLPFDTIGSTEIIQKCTDWPQDTHSFGCVTHYQDLGDAEEDIRGTPCQLQCYRKTGSDSNMMEDDVIMIFAKPMGNYLQLEINADGRLYTEETVRQWCDGLAVELEAFEDV